MKISVSNIAWDNENDAIAYDLMKKMGYSGLEIAPTKIIPDNPYDNLIAIRKWYENLISTYNFRISSMQSIWYGRQENLFGSEEERQVLLDYTKKAIDFASAIECKNLVFGCPRNRNMTQEGNINDAIVFFKKVGDYAAGKQTVIGMEANPPIYNTNFINDTKSAFELIEKVDSEGFKLNLDVGTMIQNQENIFELEGSVRLINHVHISEPGLRLIEKRGLHSELKSILMNEGYRGFVSIEMAKVEDMSLLEETMRYVKELFA